MEKGLCDKIKEAGYDIEIINEYKEIGLISKENVVGFYYKGQNPTISIPGKKNPEIKDFIKMLEENKIPYSVASKKYQ